MLKLGEPQPPRRIWSFSPKLQPGQAFPRLLILWVLAGQCWMLLWVRAACGPFLSEGPCPGLAPNHSHMTLTTCTQLPRQDAVPPSSAIQWGFGAGGGSRGK